MWLLKLLAGIDLLLLGILLVDEISNRMNNTPQPPERRRMR